MTLTLSRYFCAVQSWRISFSERSDRVGSMASSPSSPLAPLLLDVLVCPQDRLPLVYLPDESILYNDRLRRSYKIIDGIPDLLIDDAETVSDADHDRLMAGAASARRTGPAS
jgi:uncharacterized protein